MRVKSVKNGNWSDPKTWEGDRVPQDGDYVHVDHKVVCETNMKPIKGATIEINPATGMLDTSKVKFSGLRAGGVSPSSQD